MKFLVDAQLPPALCTWLEGRGHDALHVAHTLSGETPDTVVADYAVKEQRILITKDDDFALWYRQTGLAIVWVRLGNASNRALQDWLSARWESIIAALTDGEQLVEVV